LKQRDLPVLSAARSDVSSQLPIDAQMPPQDFETPGMSLLQVWSIVWAYRWQTIAIATVVTLLTAGIAKIMPKTYTASATLMVYYESHNPNAQEMPSDPLDTYISTEIQLMEAGDVLLPVVDTLKLTSNPSYIAGFHGDRRTLREWVEDNLYKDLKIEPKPGSQLISITASARDPVLAASIANSVADTFLEQERQRVFGPESERARNYAQELAELKRKVSLAQDQVTAFRQKYRMTDSASQTNTVEADLLSTLEQRYQEAQNQRRAAEVAASGDRAASTTVMGSPLIQNLKNQLSDQDRQLAQLRATMGPAHPKVIELENQMAATRNSLETELAAYSNNTSSQLAAAKQLEQKLSAAVEEQRAKVIAVRKIQDEGAKYALELDSAQSVYKHALDGYDQIMHASGEHHLSFVGRAVAPLKAAKPDKRKLVIFGAMIGLFLGLAGPFAYEIVLNRRVRCRDDFERVFGLPVLSEFGAIKLAPSTV
jgi:polysaccharide biosynthesis transport protein